LALKNVALGQAGLTFDIKRGDDLPADNDVFKVGSISRYGVDDGVTERFALVVPVACTQFVRGVLHEARHDMFSRRRDRWVSQRRKYDIDIWAARELAVFRLVVGALHILGRRRNRNGAAQMTAGSGQAFEVRKGIERKIDLSG